MNRIIWIVLLFSLYSFGQNAIDDENEVYTPFNPKRTTNTYCIKAKTLPYFNGNGYGINNSLGVEIGFFKNNSIGIDGFYNYAFDQDDNDSGKTDLHPTYLHEKAVQLNYKYYYNFHEIRKTKNIAFYNGLFYRLENIKRDAENYNETTDKKALGITIGMIKIFETSHFGFDYSLRLGKQFNDITTFDPLHNSEAITFEKKNSFYFNVAISFNYWF